MSPTRFLSKLMFLLLFLTAATVSIAQQELPASGATRLRLSLDHIDFLRVPHASNLDSSDNRAVLLGSIVTLNGNQALVVHARQEGVTLGACAEGAFTAQPQLPCVASGNSPTPQTAFSSGLSWLGGAYDLHLTFTQRNEPVGTRYLGNWSNSPSLISPLAPGQVREFTVGGIWHLGPWGDLSIAAAHGDRKGQPLPTVPFNPLDLQQTALQLGLARGTLSGGLTGRVVRPALNGPNNQWWWGGLDLGLSWRTPWSGKLSVGTQNILGTRRSKAPLEGTQNLIIDEASSRTPYVRYTQDL